ncbi:MAG: MarR family transcriptional regulator [Alteromonadaceae bacterium]|nr:MarR family transcriptional regulator [Alteromonadaceae bacterium]
MAVDDAALIGRLIGIGANADGIGVTVLKQFELGQSEHDVLACAMRQPAPHIATPNLLLEEVRITSGALTTCLNRLIKRELVERVAHTTDLRSKPIQLTDKGIELIERVTHARFNLSEKILQDFSESDKSEFVRLLKKIQSSLVKYS